MKKMSNKELRQLRRRNKSEIDIQIQRNQERVHRQFAAVLMALRDEYGFGEQRLERFMNKVVLQMSAMNANYVKPNDIFQTIYDETGFNYPEFMNRRLGGE